MLLPIPAASCCSAILICSASSSVGGWSFCNLIDPIGSPLLLVPSIAPALLNSAALPNDSARRSREVLLFSLPPFWLMAASCLAAGLSCWLLEDAEGSAGAGLLSDLAAAVAGLLDSPSDSIVIGFDSGDGLAIRLAASVDELLGGMLTSFGWSWLVPLWSEGMESWAGLPVGFGTLLRLAD